MSRPRVVVFAMPPIGHFQRLRPLVPGLVEAGLDVVVATHGRFRDDVLRAGARFLDLFERYPLDGLDDGSEPPPVRFVTYAGHYGARIARDVASLAPDLVVYDTFAVVGRVVAKALGVPYVNVVSGHDRVPGRVSAGYDVDRRVTVSAACREAVRVLREVHGLEDASHLSWVNGVSPYLNVYGEPPEYLSPEGHEAFAPVDFYGCLSDDGGRPTPPVDPWPPRRAGVQRVFVSFGSVGWRLFHPDTRRALAATAEALGERDDVDGLVSLGVEEDEPGAPAPFVRPNVRAACWVDQWAALAGADAFVTHAGLNSVHEAIFLRVPMIVYPLFADQPSLARICVDRGVATSLVESVRGPVEPADVHRALDLLAAHRAETAQALEEARRLELAVMAGRPRVLRRIAELADASRVRG